MSDPLKKIIEEEKKKSDAKLQYRSASQGEVKLPDVLPNLYPFMPKTETPTWTNLITAQDSADVNVATNKEKQKQSKINGVIGQPTQQRGIKRRLK